MEQSFTQTVYESCETFESDEESINLANLEEMKQKLNLITLHDGLIWSCNESVHFHIQNWKNAFNATQPTLTIDPHLSAKTSFHNKPTFLTQILLRYSRY